MHWGDVLHALCSDHRAAGRGSPRRSHHHAVLVLRTGHFGRNGFSIYNLSIDKQKAKKVVCRSYSKSSQEMKV